MITALFICTSICLFATGHLIAGCITVVFACLAGMISVQE